MVVCTHQPFPLQSNTVDGGWKADRHDGKLIARETTRLVTWLLPFHVSTHELEETRRRIFSFQVSRVDEKSGEIGAGSRLLCGGRFIN